MFSTRHYRKIMVCIIVSFMFLYLSCAAKEVATPLPAGQAAVVVKEEAKPPEKEGWEEKWEKTLQAARKEGKVVIYSASVAGVLRELQRPFKNKYGFNFDIVTGRTAEVSAKLLQERKSGLYLADVFIGGLNNLFTETKASGAADPIEPALILPEVRDPKVWYEGKLPWSDRDHQIFSFYLYPSPMIGINTELVKTGEIKSWQDLLETRWKGKIVINDPTYTGAAFNAFSTLLYNKVLEPDFFRLLLGQQAPVLRDERLLVDWLAKGKYAIAVWPHSSPMAEYHRAGSPIDELIVKGGSYLSMAGGNFALVNKAPHLAAATIFINWLLTRETQAEIQNYFLNQSARVDIPTDKLDPRKIRNPAEKYLISANSIEEVVLKEQEKYLDLAKQIFGPFTGR